LILTSGPASDLLAEIEANDPSADGTENEPGAQERYAVRNRLIQRLVGVAMDAGWDWGYDAHEVIVGGIRQSWPVVFIELPTGQVSWHLAPYTGKYDGHTTEEKYRRCAAFTADSRPRGSSADARQSPSHLLAAFHTRPGVDCVQPPAPTVDVPGLPARVDYIREEAQELHDAVEAGDLIGVADALGDLAYVVYGAAWRCGIDLDAVITEVHRSNMTKTPTPGDGKAIKGPGYSPPNLAAVLAGPTPEES
jgi:Phosphoribosyl-ATP pyrophosphohydrolase